MPSISDRMHCAIYVFGALELRGDGTLVLDGNTFHLPPKELDVLQQLLEAPGTVVSKGALLDSVWPGCDVGEESLTRCIYALRKLFGVYKHYIATVYGKGYRLTCQVRRRVARRPAGALIKRHVPRLKKLPLLLASSRPDLILSSPSGLKGGRELRWGMTHPCLCPGRRPGVRVHGLASMLRATSMGAPA